MYTQKDKFEILTTFGLFWLILKQSCEKRRNADDEFDLVLFVKPLNLFWLRSHPSKPNVEYIQNCISSVCTWNISTF